MSKGRQLLSIGVSGLMLFLCTENEVRHPDICCFNRTGHLGGKISHRQVDINLSGRRIAVLRIGCKLVELPDASAANA